MSLTTSQRAAVVAAIGRDRHGVLADLGELLDGYHDARRRADEHSKHQYATAPPRDTARAAKRIERAAHELQEALDSAPEMLRQRLMVKARARRRDSVPRGALPLGPGDVHDDELFHVAAVARELGREARAGKVPRGTKPDTYRRALEAAVGAVLAKHGVTVDARETGPYARVLAVVLEAATGERLPADPRPRLRPVARRLRR